MAIVSAADSLIVTATQCGEPLSCSWSPSTTFRHRCQHIDLYPSYNGICGRLITAMLANPIRVRTPIWPTKTSTSSLDSYNCISSVLRWSRCYPNAGAILGLVLDGRSPSISGCTGIQCVCILGGPTGANPANSLTPESQLYSCHESQG